MTPQLILSCCLYLFSYLIGYEAQSSNHLLILVKIGLIIASGVLFLFSCTSQADKQFKASYSVLSAAILLWQIILIVAVGKTIIYIRDYPAMINSIVWIPCSLISLLRYRRSMTSYFQSLFKDKDSIVLIVASSVLAAIVVVLSLEPEGVRFSWDCNPFYDYIRHLEFDSLFDAKQLMFSGHLSNVYVYIIVLLKLLFKDVRIAFLTVNSLCIVIASFSSVFLLRSLVPGKRPMIYVFAASVFILSPWVCGMSTYHLYDYYIWCLFPLLVLYYIRQNTTGMFISGILITFSKSPGLVVFGSLCVSILIVDSVRRRKIKAIITDIKYWCYLSISVIWGTAYILNHKSSYSDDAVFGFDPDHVLHLAKMYVTANFLWIFFILTLILMIRLFILKQPDLPERSRSVIITLVISDVVFFVFNAVCVTFRNPRYMDSHIPVLYICGIVMLLCISNRIRSLAAIICTAVISLAGSFLTFDPVSLSLYNTMNVGDHNVIDYEMNSNPSLGESIICNREYYSYEILLNHTLSYTLENASPDDTILISLGNDLITWGFSAGRYSYGINDGREDFDLFYDRTTNGLANGYDYEYFDSADMIPFCVRFVFPQKSVSETIPSHKGDVFYIYMPTLNAGKENEILKKYDVKSENEFTFRGWKMNCIRF